MQVRFWGIPLPVKRIVEEWIMSISLMIIVSARHVDGDERVRYRVYKQEERPAKPSVGEDFVVSGAEGIEGVVARIRNGEHIVEVHVEVGKLEDLETLLSQVRGWKKGAFEHCEVLRLQRFLLQAVLCIDFLTKICYNSRIWISNPPSLTMILQN